MTYFLKPMNYREAAAHQNRWVRTYADDLAQRGGVPSSDDDWDYWRAALNLATELNELLMEPRDLAPAKFSRLMRMEQLTSFAVDGIAPEILEKYWVEEWGDPCEGCGTECPGRFGGCAMYPNETRGCEVCGKRGPDVIYNEGFRAVLCIRCEDDHLKP